MSRSAKKSRRSPTKMPRKQKASSVCLECTANRSNDSLFNDELTVSDQSRKEYFDFESGNENDFDKIKDDVGNYQEVT